MNKKQKKYTKTSISQIPKAVAQRKIVPLETVLERIYTKEDLSTTCLRNCTCCRVACPQMKFSEASSIIDHVWKTWSKESRKKLFVGCIKYFFSDSLIKPCLLLDGKTCKIYGQRSLNCRLYGLWPDEAWESRVAMFVKSTGLPREKLPLNTQCKNVKRSIQMCKDCSGTGKVKNSDGVEAKCEKCSGVGKIQPPPLTIQQITSLFEMLDQADKTLGVSDLKISESWNYRTFHDWVLLKFWGEQTLTKWTSILLDTTPEQRESIIEEVEKLVENMDI